MKRLYLLFPIVFFALALQSGEVNAQQNIRHFSLKWNGIQSVDESAGQKVSVPTFDGAIHVSTHQFAPLFHEVIIAGKGKIALQAELKPLLTTPLTNEELSALRKAGFEPSGIELIQETATARGINHLDIGFIPVFNDVSGVPVKLVSFDISYVESPSPANSFQKKSAYNDHSVLSSGTWYKIRTDKSGICKVTYEQLQGMGVNMSVVTPSNIRLYGKPGGMLPENNSVFRHDDLPENAIKVITSQTGVFGPGDYFLFYASTPDEIIFNKTSKRFEHKQHLYDDYTYYFLTFQGEGKRLGEQPESVLPAQYACSTFLDISWYENDLFNLIKSGKQWIGERLDFNKPDFLLNNLSFGNVETAKQAWIRYRLVARATSSSNFSLTVNSNNLTSKSIAAYTLDAFSQEAVETKSFTPVEGAQQISIRYNTPNSTALGYIDWIELNVPRRLEYSSGQMMFADPVTALSGAVTEFNMTTNSSTVDVWEVTNPVDVKKVQFRREGNMLKFIQATDTLRRFIAWDPSQFLTAEFAGIVENQDLHSITSCEMLIVTHPDFLAQANRLADHHRIVDGMTVTVATNQQVYNEFSSGTADISAIRDFARLLYQRNEGDGKLKYLLLFGDGSYDYKDHLAQNTNYVLAFQTHESQNLVFSTASDDFFALLDDNEGADAFGKLDIGVGRFPVDTPEQAEAMVSKCINYMTGTPDNLGEWRNSLCFVADDEDSNTHIRQVEDQVTPGIEKNFPIYNINKVYMDAYTQVSTPSGSRYPEVNTRINDMMKKGVLIMNYTGHGGETGWATEAILQLNDINEWTNYNRLPVFVTATCEFSRFDDPGRVSAGEQVFLNPGGGGVALLTTTRLANAGNNVELTIDLYDTIFSIVDGNYPRFGDIIAHAKNQNSGVGLIRNFMLLGDPAMHLAYPRNEVVTTTINGKPVGTGNDTISAMSEVIIEGEIRDRSGSLMQTFNGVVDVKVFDKFKWMMTRGNDPTSYKRYFEVQENILYQGKSTVTNGIFSFSFIVPRDIDFSIGTGKISYYAHSETDDAAGYNDSILIGGVSNSTILDTTGPVITLYMNDERFKSGGVTGENPMLLAYLSDQSGLNTVGNGIGHDLVATLDGNTVNSIVLNEYYQADLDNYRSGKVTYNFSDLPEGEHTLTLKAWDVFNNSSEASIEFVVKKNLSIRIVSVNAYPNPFVGGMQIEVEHNLFSEPVDISYELFDLRGVRILGTEPVTFYSQGYRAGPLDFEGINAHNAWLLDGIYLLRVRATDGRSTSEKTIRVVKAAGNE
jgi:hypothetical protein